MEVDPTNQGPTTGLDSRPPVRLISTLALHIAGLVKNNLWPYPSQRREKKALSQAA